MKRRKTAGLAKRQCGAACRCFLCGNTGSNMSGKHRTALFYLIIKQNSVIFIFLSKVIIFRIHLPGILKVTQFKIMGGQYRNNMRLRYLSVSPMELHTSMRVQDNVNEGISTFYAELLRIRRMIDASTKQVPMLALIHGACLESVWGRACV